MSELATVQASSLALPPLEFTKEQEKMIRDTYASGASESEFQVLMTTAKVRNLNPILKQIYFVSRNAKEKDANGRDVYVKKWSAQVSIEGLRSIAERTGKYAGSSAPEFGYTEGRTRKMKCAFTGKPFEQPIPVTCKVGIRRRDWAEPCFGVVHVDEFVQTSKYGVNKFWDEKTHVMMAKCAEAVGLRKAFPEDLSGLFISEEMPPVLADDAKPVAYTVDDDGVVTDVVETKALPPAAKKEKKKKEAPPAELEEKEEENLEKTLEDSIAEEDAKEGLHRDEEFPGKKDPNGDKKLAAYKKAVFSRGGLMGKLISDVDPRKIGIYRDKYLLEKGGIPEAELNAINYYAPIEDGEIPL